MAELAYIPTYFLQCYSSRPYEGGPKPDPTYLGTMRVDVLLGGVVGHYHQRARVRPLTRCNSLAKLRATTHQLLLVFVYRLSAKTYDVVM